METPDDYQAMRTALRRRLQRLGDATFGSLPDLILADGGIGHVAALRQVVRDLNLSIPVAGMVKDDRHRTRGLVTPDGRVINLRPSAGSGSVSILADADTTMPDDAAALALLRLLTAIQDEAHRFAGRYRQKLHNRRQLRFSLENIAGVGPARRRLLLQHFHSIKKIAAATLDELKAVRGLDDRTVRSVYDHFHAGEQEGA
jgi:excinuclease ABC subunit C